MDVFWLIFKQFGSWAILENFSFVGQMQPKTIVIYNWQNYLHLLQYLTTTWTPYFVNSDGI